MLKATPLFILLFAASVCQASGDIFQAVDSAQVQVVADMLNEDLTLINAVDESGMTLLSRACSAGNLEIASLLIGRGCDYTIGDANDLRPVHYSAISGNTELLKLLYEKGEQIDIRDGNDVTPLLWAIFYERTDASLWLMKTGADCNVVSKRGTTTVLAAVRRKLAGLVDSLLHHGADIEYPGFGGRTPLIFAVREGGDIATVKVLIEHGANVNAADDFGDTPLGLAAWRGFEDIVNLLLDNSAEIHQDKNTSWKLLNYAAERGLERLMRELEARGHDLNIRTKLEGSLLHPASMGGSLEIVAILLQAGLDYNERDRYGWTPLHYAAVKGRSAVVRALLESKASVDVLSLAGHTALSLANDRGHTEVAEMLTASGAKIARQQFPDLSGPYLGQDPPGTEPELFAPDIVSVNWGNHGTIVFSPDGKEAVWNSYLVPEDSGYGQATLYMSRMKSGKWTIPEQPPFADNRDEFNRGDCPYYSRDGKRIYFTSVRFVSPDEERPVNMYWTAERDASGWQPPTPFNSIAEGLRITDPLSQSNDGTLYFSDASLGGQGSFDIFRSVYTDFKFAEPENLGDTINTSGFESSPFIAPDGSYLLFVSTGHGNGEFGFEPIFVSWRMKGGGWSEPKYTGLDGRRPIVSEDGKYVFYLSPADDNMVSTYWVRSDFLWDLKPVNP